MRHAPRRSRDRARPAPDWSRGRLRAACRPVRAWCRRQRPRDRASPVRPWPRQTASSVFLRVGTDHGGSADRTQERQRGRSQHDQTDAVGERFLCDRLNAPAVSDLFECGRIGREFAARGFDGMRGRWRQCLIGEVTVEPAIVGGERGRAQDGNGEKVCQRCHGVVDTGRDARLPRRYRIDHRRRQRSDRDRHAEPKRDDRHQEIRACGHERSGHRQQRETERSNHWPDDERKPRAETVDQPAGPARETRHDEGERQEDCAGARRRIAMHLDEQVWQEEERAAQRRIKKESQQVDAAERARAEEREWHCLLYTSRCV